MVEYVKQCSQTDQICTSANYYDRDIIQSCTCSIHEETASATTGDVDVAAGRAAQWSSPAADPPDWNSHPVDGRPTFHTIATTHRSVTVHQQLQDVVDINPSTARYPVFQGIPDTKYPTRGQHGMTLVRKWPYPVPTVNAYQPLVGFGVLLECTGNQTLSAPVV